jgi:type I restriction enzyme S subunit
MELKLGYKQTEVGVIPEDWDVRPLSNISLKIMVGIASAATHAYRLSGIPMIRNQNIKPGHLLDSDLLFIDQEYEKTYRNKRLLEGDLLTTRTGYPGTTCIVPAKYKAAQSFTTLITRPDTAQITSKFLCLYINSEHGQRFFESSQIGGAQKNVNTGTLKKMPIPIPTVSEQTKVSNVLGAVEELLASLENLIAKKRALKQAAMQELLTGKRRLPGFEGEWEEVQLGDIAAIRNAKAVASSMPAETRCIELECIEQGSSRLLMSNHPTGETTKYTFKKGDVLFGRLRAYLRKFWLASFDGVCSTEIWPLITRDERLSAGFLHLLVQTNDFIDAACISYGTHMPRSDWAVLRKFQLKLPPRPEQDAIATVMADIDAELSDLVRRSQKAACLRQGMMQQLLTGKIRLT